MSRFLPTHLHRSLLFLLGTVVLPVKNAEAQSVQGTPFLKNYTVREFKAYHQNWACIQDCSGIMYFANNNGVLEYDGVSWDLLPVPNRSTVRSLGLDRHNRLYVGAQGEFGYVERDRIGRIVYRSLKDSLPLDDRQFADVWSVHTASTGVYFRTRKAIFRWTSDGLHAIESRTVFQRSYLVRDTVFVVQEGIGLCRVVGDRLETVPGGDFFENLQAYVMVPFDSNRTLIGTSRKGFFLYDGRRVTPFRTTADDQLADRQVYNGAMLPDGRVALATLYGGLIVLDQGGRVSTWIDKSSGLINEKVHNVFADRQGAVWLALDNGLARVEVSSPFLMIGEESGLEGNVQSVARFEGRLVAATSTGVFRLEEVAATRWSPPRFTPIPDLATQCWSLLAAGGVLLCATNTGIWQLNGDRPTRIEKGTAFLLERSRLDSQVIYVGMKDGLGFLRFKDGRWVFGGMVDGVSGEIRAIAEIDRAVWLGSKYQGVWRVDVTGGMSSTASFARFDTSHGLPPGWIRAFRVGKRPVFTTESGLFKFDAATQHFRRDSSFGAEYAGPVPVSPLYEDGRGRVWLTSGSDVALAVPREGLYDIHRFALQRIPEEAEINVLYEDEAGLFWMGGTSGLIAFLEERTRTIHRPPATMLQRIVSLARDSVLQRFSEAPLILPNSLNALRFEYALAAFDNESENEFQFVLEGFDDHWSEWARQTQKEYTNLPGGAYTFRVRGRDVYGQVSEEARFDFRIRPPWYWTWYSILAYFAMAAGFLYGGIRWRVRILEERNLRLKEKVEQRTKELQEAQVKLIHSEKMASLGQMVAGLAHEINNPLTFVYANQEFIHDRVTRLLELIDELEGRLTTIHPGSRGDLQRMKDDLEYDRLRIDLADAIRSSINGSERIKNIVENLRSFANIDEKPFRRTDLDANLDVIMDLFLRQYKDIHFEREKGALPQTMCNPAEINQCFLNILRNGVQAVEDAQAAGRLPRGEGRIAIRSSFQEANGEGTVHFSFSDNGIGIPSDVVGKVFDPFFTTRKIGLGKGLGLTEAYGIIQKHNGTIEVRSDESSGTEIIVRLPCGNRAL